jgi:hypothetical protein
VKNYLLSRGKTPLDYVLGKFEDHDIVLLGEMHYIRRQGRIFSRFQGREKRQTNTRRIPTVLVGIPRLTPASETVGLFEIFDLRPGFLQTKPPSKTSISCGLP